MVPHNNAEQYFRTGIPGQPILPQRMSDAEHLERLETESLARGPMQVQSIEEPFLLAKTAQAGRGLDETLLAYVGRTGLNHRQLREWSIERISAFVAVVEANAGDLAPEPKISF